jgi:hypothetical protein
MHCVSAIAPQKKDLADKIEITASDLPENVTRQEQNFGMIE